MRKINYFALTFACFQIAAYSQYVPYPDEGPAVYVVRVISAGSAQRDAFVACLAKSDLPFWRGLKEKRLLARVSVFETTSVTSSDPGVPAWNFVISSQLAEGASADSFVQAVEKRKGCETAPGVEVRRIETMRTTPNCNYARTAAADDLKGRDSKVVFRIEYFDVKDTPAALDQFREIMRLNDGPAAGLRIRDGWMFSALALETVQVNYSQPGLPGWNQIHVLGKFPGKEPTDAVRDSYLRQVNPENGGRDGVYALFAGVIRTVPKVDLARELFELALR